MARRPQVLPGELRGGAADTTGSNGAYRKSAAPAYAMRLDQPQDVPVGWQNDPLHGEPGDWLLQYADRARGVLHDQIFRESYDPAPGETRWPPPA